MTALQTTPPATDVLNFWFGDALQLGWPSNNRNAMWFGAGAALDADIRQRFRALVESAVEGGLAGWEKQPMDRLALVILLDQFTRNVFRAQARAFAGDARAQALVLDALARRWDTELPLVGRVFLNMPLVHAENIGLQDEAARQIQSMLANAPPDRTEVLRPFLASALEHRAIIAQFGRFPHRNKVLGRTDTAAEQDFLLHGPRFGQ